MIVSRKPGEGLFLDQFLVVWIDVEDSVSVKKLSIDHCNVDIFAGSRSSLQGLHQHPQEEIGRRDKWRGDCVA